MPIGSMMRFQCKGACPVRPIRAFKFSIVKLPYLYTNSNPRGMAMEMPQSHFRPLGFLMEHIHMTNKKLIKVETTS